MTSARIITFSVLAMLLGISIFFLTSCLKYEEVKMLGVQGVNLKKFESSGVEIAVKVKISNPNNYKIKVVGSDLELFVKDQSVGDGKLKNKVTIPKRSTETHEFVITTGYKNLMKAVTSSLLSMFGGGIEVKVKGHIKVRAKLLSKKVPIEVKHKVNTKDLKLPF